MDNIIILNIVIIVLLILNIVVNLLNMIAVADNQYSMLEKLRDIRYSINWKHKSNK